MYRSSIYKSIFWTGTSPQIRTMGLKVRLFFICSALVLALAYYSRPVFPDTANKPLLKSFFGLAFRCIFLFADVGQYLGIASSVNITRTVIQTNVILMDDGGNGNILQSASTIEGVKVLVFRPKAEVATRRPGIVYYHGGGWTIMTPGDSAGGNLAMAVALSLTKEKDASLPKIRLQSLIYPGLQFFDFYLPAYVKHGNGPGLLRKRNAINFLLSYAFGNDSLYNAFASNSHISDELRNSKYATYVNVDILPKDIQGNIEDRVPDFTGNKTLSDAIEHIMLDPRFAPLMSSDEELALLPPTYILTAEFDVLRDDSFLAAGRLKNVGVPVEHIYLPGEEHGFLNLITVDNNVKEEIKRFAVFFKKTVS